MSHISPRVSFWGLSQMAKLTIRSRPNDQKGPFRTDNMELLIDGKPGVLIQSLGLFFDAQTMMPLLVTVMVPTELDIELPDSELVKVIGPRAKQMWDLANNTYLCKDGKLSPPLPAEEGIFSRVAAPKGSNDIFDRGQLVYGGSPPTLSPAPPTGAPEVKSDIMFCIRCGCRSNEHHLKHCSCDGYTNPDHTWRPLTNQGV
jgi:ribosomal protein L37E